MTATQQERAQQQIDRLLAKHAKLREKYADVFEAVEVNEDESKKDKLIAARDKVGEEIGETADMLRLAGYTLETDDAEPVKDEPKEEEVKVPDNAVKFGSQWFVPTSGLTSKKSERVRKLMRILQEQQEPIEFATLADRAGERYPQDVQAAVMAMEVMELVESFHLYKDGTERNKLYVLPARKQQEEAPAAA